MGTLFENFLKATTFRQYNHLEKDASQRNYYFVFGFLHGRSDKWSTPDEQGTNQGLSQLGLQGISMDSLSSGQKEQICDTMLSSYKTSGVSQEIQDVAVETINDVFGLTCGSSRATSTTIYITVLINFTMFFLMK